MTWIPNKFNHFDRIKLRNVEISNCSKNVWINCVEHVTEIGFKILSMENFLEVLHRKCSEKVCQNIHHFRNFDFFFWKFWFFFVKILTNNSFLLSLSLQYFGNSQRKITRCSSIASWQREFWILWIGKNVAVASCDNQSIGQSIDHKTDHKLPKTQRFFITWWSTMGTRNE